MGHSHFLNLTCDIEENKRQRCAALPLLSSGGEQHEVLLFGSIKEGIFQARH